MFGLIKMFSQKKLHKISNNANAGRDVFVTSHQHNNIVFIQNPLLTDFCYM